MSNETKKTALPKLRFPEFQDAEEWKEKKLGNIMVEARLGSNFQTSETGSGTPVIKMANLNRGKINLNKVEYLAENSTYTESDLLKAGDLLFNTRNTLELVGKVAIWKDELPLAVYNTNLLRLEFDDIAVSSNYFMNYLFNTQGFIDKLRGIATGTTSVAAIYSKDLNKLTINIPLPEEQKKIAATLSSLDDLITAQNAKLKALQVHKRGLMQGLFPVEGEMVPKLRFPEFQDAEEWKEKTLGEISTITSGATPNRAKPEYWNGNIPWVTTTLVEFNVIKSTNEYITEAGLQNSSAKIFPKNTILMAMYGQGKTRGQVAILGIDATTNQACAAIILNNGFDTNFVYQNLAARYQEIRELSNQGGQENLSGALIKSISFTYPEIDEQQKIADCLTSLDNSITAQRETIEALRLHKKGLMQGLFPVLTNSEA